MVRHAGDDAFCPCCGDWQASFQDLVMPDRMCRICNSLERDRLVRLLFDLRPTLLRPGAVVLHIAPERPLAPALRAAARTYVSGDLNADLGPIRLDVLDLPFNRDEFDVVVCNHVLEHVEQDRRAMSELRRVLRPGGWAMLLVPDVREPTTFESMTATSAKERLRLYGQDDHVRRYGWDYLDRLRESGFEPEVIRLDTVVPPETVRTCRLMKMGEIEPLFIAT